MSDSENELFPVMHKFRQESSIVSVRGPQINRTLTNAFRGNNMLSSTMLMPRSFGRHGYDPNMYQNSICSRRETSPTSLCSVPALQRPHFNDSYYHRNKYLQRSVRGTSPMSLRSFDSNASISAVDIAMALKSTHFNNNEMRIIKDAFKNLIKSSSRRRIEKRRRKRFRCDKRKSDDSGEQGSSESDDCRSLRTNTHKDLSSNRSTRTDLSFLKHSLKESDIYKDCTDKFRQHTFKNTLFTGPKSIHGDSIRPPLDSIREVRSKGPRSVCSESQIRNGSVPLLKDRFKCSNNFLLPSQRFNRSVAASTILENPNKSRLQDRNLITTKKKQTSQSKQIVSYQTDSDENDLNCHTMRKDDRNYDDFFSSPQRKRTIDCDADTPDSKKRNKNPTPKKTSRNIIQKNIASPIQTKPSNEFEFAKPMFPVRKPVNRKDKETVISKAAPVIFSNSAEPHPITKNMEHNEINNLDGTEITDEQSKNPNSSSDISMRPSFIKRKLFSQKLDVTEAKNGPDSSPDSPQVNTYSDLMKEKTKARKLVANQSCLSRDIAPGSDNFIDLLHKIVPPERMNVTSASNVSNITIRTKSNATHLKDTTDPDDKWDVTSILSTCNKSEVSDTFTDEEIFGFSPKTKGKQNGKIETMSNKNNISNNNIKTQKNNLVKKDLIVVVDRTICKNDTPAKPINPISKGTEAKRPVRTFVDNFFETDYETDSENRKMGTFTLPNHATNNMEKAAVTQERTTTIVKTPLQKKNLSKKLTPVVELAECKKKPGLKNYFQRILKGKNKENVSKQESTKVITTDKIQVEKPSNPQKVNEIKNKHVETIIQIQESVKKANIKQVTDKNNVTKKNEPLQNKSVVKKTAQTEPAKLNETIYNNDRSRRVRTPRLQKFTLDVSNNLNATKKSSNTKTQKDNVTEKKPRGRPKKITATPQSKDSVSFDSSPSLNTTMCLRDRNKQASKGKDIKDNVNKEKTKKNNSKKDISLTNLSPIKVVRAPDFNNVDNEPKTKKSKLEPNNKSKMLESNNHKTQKKGGSKNSNCKALENSLLNTSMTLRVRKPLQKNTSYVY